MDPIEKNITLCPKTKTMITKIIGIKCPPRGNSYMIPANMALECGKIWLNMAHEYGPWTLDQLLSGVLCDDLPSARSEFPSLLAVQSFSPHERLGTGGYVYLYIVVFTGEAIGFFVYWENVWFQMMNTSLVQVSFSQNQLVKINKPSN